MRRAFGIVLTALLALSLLAVPALADDSGASTPSEVVLAVEGAPAGPEPMDRQDPDNKARELAGFENPDVPWTWYASFLLSVAGLAGLALLVGLYYLLVQRPSRESSESS